ncbi:MAG: FAD:protein transferase [Ilumatobacteraceae bacterium]|nr:FAD:protein transferase [Ilumatobacteraceae bacterium]
MPPGDPPLVSVYEPLLGTVVEVRVNGDPEATEEADRMVLEEIRRLERVFSVFDENSELCRWRRGDDVAVSEELAGLLELALQWQRVSCGAFNPAAGALASCWAAAASAGRPPLRADLDRLAASIREPRYDVVGGVPRRIRDCSVLDFNAIAKGHIVDLAVARASVVPGVVSLVVNAGGDLLHSGAGSVRVGIENPATPYDNAPPLAVVEIANRGLATSGSARRGVRIGEQWFGHVLDPRTGDPVERISSTTVIAADAATADVVATVVGVLDPLEGLAVVDARVGVECLVVESDGGIWRSAGWDAFERPQRSAM